MSYVFWSHVWSEISNQVWFKVWHALQFHIKWNFLNWIWYEIRNALHFHAQYEISIWFRVWNALQFHNIVWNFKWSLTYSMKCIAISCEGTKILCQMEAFKLPNPIHRIKNNFHFSKAQKKRRNRQKYKIMIQSLIHIHHIYLSL